METSSGANIRTVSSSTARNKFPRLQRWIPGLIVAAIVIAAPLVLYGIAQFGYQQRINQLKTENQKMWQDVVKPLGGVEFGSSVVCPQFLDPIGAVDTGPCPRASSTWLVPVAIGKESSFTETLLLKEGYSRPPVSTPDSAFGGLNGATKGELSLDVYLSDLNGKQPPYPAPDGSVWRVVSINVYD